MRVCAGSDHHLLHLDEVCELVIRHGQDPMIVNWIEDDIIDIPLLRFGVYQKNEDGHFFMRAPDEIAMCTVERALVGTLPEWWPDDHPG